jgi:LuxR family maltose regulon positive regulatory protein
MPKSAGYTLTWSCSRQVYELNEIQRNKALDIVPESPDWLVWVSQISSFAFHGQHGSYTARKEGKQRGEGYWYAYSRVGEKLSKRYLGKGADLTLARLERVAQELRRDPQTASQQHTSPTPSTSFPQPGRRLATRNSHPARSRLPTAAILATKLYVPHPCPYLVHRPRLIQRLQHGPERSLILLSAPAGFGKSTLLADWLTCSARPVAWLSLESQDNEPRRFLSYLIAALQSYDPHLGLSALAFLNSLPSVPSVAIETVLTLLINDLLMRRTDDQEPIVLILDNYQVITTSLVHSALSFVLDHLPPRTHLVLATREDPPLPLIHLRGRDAVLELRAADLRFTLEETVTYLVEVMGLSLSIEQSALLQERTEGWITGLQLAARSLVGRDDVTSFITAFSGSHHYVMDYLLEEVLSRQGEAVQDFLLQTCILDRLCAPLCDAVRAQPDSEPLLDFLERANLFLIALDDERQWYRYHHLFTQVLRQRLQQIAPTLVSILHRRASCWYEQHGLIVEAISHALAAPAFEEAAHLVEQYAWMFLIDHQLQILCGWLHALPEPMVLARPSLCLMHAIALIYTNQLEAASARLQTVERRLDLGEDRPDAQGRVLLGQVVACRSLLARLSGDLKQCVILSHQTLDLLRETEVTTPLTRMLRAWALIGAAHGYLVSGDVTPASERLLTETVTFSHTSPDSRLLLPAGLTLLARLQTLQGRLHQAAATYQEVVQAVRAPEELHILVNSPVYYFGLGDLLREWNKLEAAEQHLVQGMNLVRGEISVGANIVWLGYAALAHLHQARRRYDQALTTLDTFMQLAELRHMVPVLIAQAAAMRAHIELARDNLPAARRWRDTCRLSVNDPPDYLREREYLTLARVCIAEMRDSPTRFCLVEVLVLLERLLANAEANMRMRSMLEILLLRVQALEVQGDHTGALATLGHALTLAEPEGYIRLFLDEGPLMLALLRRAQRLSLAPGYIAKLLRGENNPEGSNAHVQAQPDSLLEPLTAREGDVLQLLLDGASNQEIARQLVVSMNTVKKHIVNIYGKLNVRSRAQAIAKVRMLHLL